MLQIGVRVGGSICLRMRLWWEGGGDVFHQLLQKRKLLWSYFRLPRLLHSWRPGAQQNISLPTSPKGSAPGIWKIKDLPSYYFWSDYWFVWGHQCCTELLVMNWCLAGLTELQIRLCLWYQLRGPCILLPFYFSFPKFSYEFVSLTSNFS